MATSGYIQNIESFGFVRLSWTVQSQSEATNSTVISYRLIVQRNTGEFSSSAKRAYSVKINGAEVASGSVSLLGSGTATVASGTATIPHNNDGAKTFSLSFSQEIGLGYGTLSASGIGTLPAIKRPTAPSITKLKVYRVNANGVADDQGEYAAIEYYYYADFTGGEPDVEMTLDYKQSSSTDYTVLATSTSSVELNTIKPTVKFSVDYQYDIRMTVEDSRGLRSTYTATLPSGAVILDLKADGLGISFGKTADKAGVDFGWSPKGAVLGLWEATAQIPENGDANGYTKPGVYSIPSNAIAETISNLPCAKGGTIRVWAGLGTKKIDGAWAYITQEYHSYHNDIPVYRRALTSDDSGAFTASEWKPITLKGQKVLWADVKYMTEGHTAELSEPISKQDNGIVLVFSRYEDGAAQEHHYSCHFVPKQYVALKGGYGVTFTMQTSQFAVMACKYLYISDNHITGNAANSATGTAASGITYANNGFVLRYVLGV